MKYVLPAYSWGFFDELTSFVLQQIKPRQVLDIGAGEGKYGRMVRAAGLTETRVTAVEMDPARREGLLAAGYDEVLSIAAIDLLKEPTRTYDLVILGDVIEHMRKSEGQDLLEFLNYRSAYILVITPEAMPMSLPNFYEGHNSLWRPEAMQWHDLWAWSRAAMMYFYLLRGYLDGEKPYLRAIVQAANAQGFIAKLDPTGTRDVRCELQVHDRVTHEPIPSMPGSSIVYRYV